MSETLSQPTPHCPNCGAPRAERFCAACGQNSRSYLRATTVTPLGDEGRHNPVVRTYQELIGTRDSG